MLKTDSTGALCMYVDVGRQRRPLHRTGGSECLADDRSSSFCAQCRLYTYNEAEQSENATHK